MKSMIASVGFSVVLAVTVLSACAVKYPMTGEVTSYGLMRHIGTWEKAGTCYSPSADAREETGVVVTQETDKIPAKRYTEFGIKYELSGDIRNSYIKYRGVVTHPPMKLPTGKTSTGETHNIECWSRKDTVSGWGSMKFSEEYEIVMGRWTFEIWSQDRRLIQKEFTIVNTEMDM